MQCFQNEKRGPCCCERCGEVACRGKRQGHEKRDSLGCLGMLYNKRWSRTDSAFLFIILLNPSMSLHLSFHALGFSPTGPPAALTPAQPIGPSRVTSGILSSLCSQRQKKHPQILDMVYWVPQAPIPSLATQSEAQEEMQQWAQECLTSRKPPALCRAGASAVLKMQEYWSSLALSGPTVPQTGRAE